MCACTLIMNRVKSKFSRCSVIRGALTRSRHRITLRPVSCLTSSHGKINARLFLSEFLSSIKDQINADHLLSFFCKDMTNAQRRWHWQGGKKPEMRMAKQSKRTRVQTMNFLTETTWISYMNKDKQEKKTKHENTSCK